MGNNCQPTSVVTTNIGIYEFKSTSAIGTGSFGTIYKGHDVSNKKKSLAIKCIHGTFSLSEYNRIQGSLRRLESVYGENTLAYTDHYYDENTQKLYLISDFFPYGNLNDLILDGLKTDPLEDLRTAIGYCQQIIQGVFSLHIQGIIHGKLTPKNILVQYSRLVINDFGLEALVGSGNSRPKIFDAPELADGYGKLTEKCDIWSLGVIMYLLVYKTNPLKILGREYIFYNFQEGKCSLFDDLIKRCLTINPDERISLKEIERHPFLNLDPASIEFLPSRWAGVKSPQSTSSHAAYKMFHQMEINYNFASMT